MLAGTRGERCLRALGSTGHRHDLAPRPFPSFQTTHSGPPASALTAGLQSLAGSTGLACEPLLSCWFHPALHLALSSDVTARLSALTVRWEEYVHSSRDSPLCAALRWPALEAQEWWRWPCTVTAEVAPHGQDCGRGRQNCWGTMEKAQAGWSGLRWGKHRACSESGLKGLEGFLDEGATEPRPDI